MKKITLFFIILGVCYQHISYGQAREWTDSINTNKQELPYVVQQLSDGTLLMGATQRDFLFGEKGKLIVAWMNMEGNLIRSNKIELPELNIVDCGGIFKNDTNEFIAFCTFDTTPSPNYRFSPSLWGYILFDSLLNFIDYKVTQPQFRTTGRNLISDIRVKYWKDKIYYGSIEIFDNIPGSPGIAEIIINPTTYTLTTRWDTLWKSNYNDNTYNGIKFGDFRNDFEIIFDRYYLTFEMPLYVSGTTFIRMFDLHDSIYKFIYNGHLPVPADLDTRATHGFKFGYRSNIRYYKDSLLLVAGSGRYWHNGYMIDTIYMYSNPIQSAIAFLKVNDSILNNIQFDPIRGVGIPSNFTFVHKLQPFFTESYDEFNSRFFTDVHTNAFNQCLDFKDYNKIYYACQHSDMLNMRFITERPSIISISQFDSTLTRTWERRIHSTTREGVVSVNATNDGGCVLVTRKQNGRMADPTFADSVSSFDIAVYKINASGVMTSLNKFNFNKPAKSSYTLYPNPAKDVVQIQSQHNIHTIAVWDSKGKQHTCAFNTENQSFSVQQLPVGIYFIQLFDANSQLLDVVKLVRE